MYTVYFTMSEAQAEDFPHWENMNAQKAVGDLGVQLTYEHLRDCNTGETIATFSDGFWRTADGGVYSDVVIVVAS